MSESDYQPDGKAPPDANLIERATKWALDLSLHVDREQALGDVRSVRAKYPGASRAVHADQLIARARWKAAAVGIATGMPSNPWVAGGAAVTDVAFLLRIEVALAARIALLFDETFLDDAEPPYELLVPILGGRFAAEVAREVAIRGGMGVTRSLIRKYISKGVLDAIKRLALRYLGLKITQRMLITKVIPVVGGVIGGGWNFGEVGLVGHRVVHYFEDKPSEENQPGAR